MPMSYPLLNFRPNVNKTKMCLMSNQMPQVEEQTIQLPTEKGQKTKQ
jgi:hypothetical protein